MRIKNGRNKASDRHDNRNIFIPPHDTGHYEAQPSQLPVLQAGGIPLIDEFKMEVFATTERKGFEVCCNFLKIINIINYY